MYRTVLWTLWERDRVGRFGRMALKHVYYHVWNKSPVQVRCTILDAWGWCTGTTQRDGTGREEGSGWGTHVYLWWIHFDVWQNQYNIVKFKNKIKLKKKKRRRVGHNGACTHAILLSGMQSFPWAMSFLCIPRDLSTNYHHMPYTHSVS